MEALLLLIIINTIVLIFAFRKNIGLFTITREQQWQKKSEEFDKNFKELEQESDFKIDPDHLYK